MTAGAPTEPASDRPTLLFDDSCPMCQVYTGAFEQLGWAGKRALGQCDDATLARLDLDRARHEIPMIDPMTGEIHYGLDALTSVIGAQSKLLGHVMSWPATRAVARPMYWFISYNRREMAGCPPPSTGFDCAPDFHRGWTSTYLASCAIVMLGGARVAAPAIVTTLAAGATLAAETIRNDRRATVRRFTTNSAGDGETIHDDGRFFRLTAQVATSAIVATAVTVGARAIGARPSTANVVAAAAGLHQVWRRRFLGTL